MILACIKEFNLNDLTTEIDYLKKLLIILSNTQRKVFMEKIYASPVLEALICLILPEFYSHCEILTEIFWFLSNLTVYSKSEEISILMKLGLFDKCIALLNECKIDLLIHDVKFFSFYKKKFAFIIKTGFVGIGKFN